MKLPEIKTHRLPQGLVPQADMVANLLVAMRHGLCVVFNYDGKLRVVEVHALGISTKDGGVLMRGFQIAGDASRPLPQWTLYRLDKIDAVACSFTESHGPRDGYKMGDSQMGNLIAELVL